MLARRGPLVQHRAPMRLSNYSGSIVTTAKSARSVADVAALEKVIRDQPANAPLLLRANGNSIHDQALTKRDVVLLDGLSHRVSVKLDDEVTLDAAGTTVPWTTVRVTAWTPWEVVVRAALRVAEHPENWNGSWDVNGTGGATGSNGNDVCVFDAAPGHRRFMPYVVPSSGRITVGGSLAADTMWRFSAMFGHQARGVVWVDLLAYGGQGAPRVPYRIRLFNSEAGIWEHRSLHAEASIETAASRAVNDEWFDAVIGGFGMLGPILEAKLLLLELSDTLESTDFPVNAFPDPTPPPPPSPGTPGPPRARDRVRPDLDDRSDIADPWEPTPEQRREIFGIDRDDDEGPARSQRGSIAPPFAWSTTGGPSYPHAGYGELGDVGGNLPQRAITWMWVTDEPRLVFDDLYEHHLRHAAKAPTAGIALPPIVDADTFARFGMFFPNRTNKLVTAVGSIAFAKPKGQVSEFPMWDRDYSRKRLALVLAALPGGAGLGEKAAYKAIFEGLIDQTANHVPGADPIPEFALFMEGHSAGVDGMLGLMPETIQQTWVLPIVEDPAAPDPREPPRKLLQDFLAEVHAISTKPYKLKIGSHPSDPIRIQVCDVKILPKGRSTLSSASSGPCVAVTLAVENGKAYGQFGWGSPVQQFIGLSQKFAGRGVKVHLTKNRYVAPADFATMYGAPTDPSSQLGKFKRVKDVLDRDGIYGTMFSEDVDL